MWARNFLGYYVEKKCVSGPIATQRELTVVLFMFCLAQMAYDPGLTTAMVALS